MFSVTTDSRRAAAAFIRASLLLWLFSGALSVAPARAGRPAALPPSAPSNKWEMVIDYAEDGGQDKNEPVTGQVNDHTETRGYDKITAHTHADGHVTAVLEVIPSGSGGGVRSVRLVKVQGSGSYESTREQHYHEESPIDDQGHKITTDFQGSARSSGQLDPSKLATDLFFVVTVFDAKLRKNPYAAKLHLTNSLLGGATIHYKLASSSHGKKVILNSAGEGTPTETNDSNVHDFPLLVSADGPITDAMIQARSFSVTKTETLKDPPQLAMGIHDTSTITVHVHPLGPKEEMELVVEPDQYAAWIPAGGPDPGTAGASQSIAVRATLRTKSGKPVPPDRLASRIVFKLAGVSHEPGTCMNAPLNAPDDGTPDLKIEKTTGVHVLDDKGQSAEKLGPTTVAAVSVASSDYGAYGDLTVTADLPDGTQVTGHLAGVAPGAIPLPKRAAGSKIASAWHHGGGDGSDDESAPVGNGFAGDGLTLYEEYRGFVCGGKHVRTDPARKDLFILVDPAIKAAAATGLGYFKAGTRLAVHDELLAGEVGPDRVINPNVGSGGNHVAQHAIHLAQSAGDDNAAEEIGTPAQCGQASVSAPPSGTRARQEWDATVAHELLHDCCVYHHGDGDRTPVTWVKSPDGSVYERWQELKGNTTHNDKITLKDETGHVLSVSDPTVAPLFEGNYASHVYVATWNGEHSGVEDCVMRYSVGMVLPSGQIVTIVEGHPDASVRYVIPRAEKVGTGLCSSATGTGVNQAGRTPLQWHGDAKAGDCAHKFCVSDRYHGSGGGG